MANIKEILSEEELQSLLEDTGLTENEVTAQYKEAIAKATKDSKPESMNRKARRAYDRKLKKINKLIGKGLFEEKTISERFSEMPEEKQKDIYMKILKRVKKENEHFEKIKEKKENKDDIN